MHIRDLDINDQQSVERAVAALVAGFHLHWPTTWPDFEPAHAEVFEAIPTNSINNVALSLSQ